MEKDSKDIVIHKLCKTIVFLMLIIAGLTICICCLLCKIPSASSVEKEPVRKFSPEELQGVVLASYEKEKISYWIAPDTLSPVTDAKEIKYGRDLIVRTAHYFGANGILKKGASNGLNCQNCHLEGGTKIFGNNYSAVYATYPKYRPRSGAMENIVKRISDCFERSLNGTAPDSNSYEMKAMIKYIHYLGHQVPKGKKPEGSGLKDLPFMEIAASPESGKVVYMQKCKSCHGDQGEGKKQSDGITYIYPPLWGKESYNDAAGLYRVSNFAKFVKFNMPLGVQHDAPQLSDEEAWHVAAYVNSQPRPHKAVPKDWPKIKEKPIDHPFGPYADEFSEEQHKYGPFLPIKKVKDKEKKEKEKTVPSVSKT